jgi:DNA-binding PadR family transcriptional regulator
MAASAATKTDLLLLGLLLDRPMHGYELYQQIQSEGIDRWFNVSAAGVYYSLRKLHEQGHVVETGQPGSGSARKAIYRLTEDGRRAFFAAMEIELASHDQTCLDYDLVIYLLNRFPLQRALPQLEKRQAFLTEQRRKVEAELVSEREGGNPALVMAILDHKLRFLDMEQHWLAQVIANIRQTSEDGDDADQEPGFMILNGDLRDLHLPDLFHLIVSGQYTGTLTVSEGVETRTLTFEEGQPVYASSLRRGEPPVPLSSCEEVLEGLCEIFSWRTGRFSFDQRPGYPEGSVPLGCSAEELILRGCRQVDNWAIIQQLVPSADTIFELGGGYGRLDPGVLTPGEAMVAGAVDGVKDVAAIARERDLSLFAASRILYCLTAIGALRTADLDKIHLRQVFREIAELMCSSTLAWRTSPEDRECEKEVNQRTEHLPIRLNHGRVEDLADPQLGTEKLKEIYYHFLEKQFKVICQRFGQSSGRQALEQAMRRLPPELRGVARRYGFDQIARN